VEVDKREAIRNKITALISREKAREKTIYLEKLIVETDEKNSDFIDSFCQVIND